ncbi:MAG: 3-deoxy-manno-octulosonate cytidylyltransferase [Bacteroidales bacterium]|nr:3-deoxy-manno-octulosonate cytidylyltransferase [Bacteroidales bacterium]
MDQFIAIIPARYASTRFPGKPLASLAGKPMIQWVYERTAEVITETVVATDDKRIENAVNAFGGNVIMTGEHHKSGTDRCAEALLKYQELTGKQYTVVINVQGDEPFIQPSQIEKIREEFSDHECQIATLIKKIDTQEVLFDPNRPKVITDNSGYAIYFSRSVIPYVRGKNQKVWLTSNTFYQHIGMYAYRSEILLKITKLKPSALEMAESLEQLRWLENGFYIKTALTEYESMGIDTPEDLNNLINSGVFNKN